MRTPVSIVTGQLGSGKTTLVNQLVRHKAYANSLVVINEFGEIGIDHLLVSAPAENIVLLENGCLCCSMQGDLVDTFAAIARRRDQQWPKFDQVILETSGIVDPIPIMRTLAADEVISEIFSLDLILTVVDAVNAETQRKSHEWAKQLAVADLIVITKGDLALASEIARLRQLVECANPSAAVIDACGGQFDPSQLIECRRQRVFSDASLLSRWLNSGTSDELSHGHSHGSLAGAGKIDGWSTFYDKPIARSGLILWLNWLSHRYGRQLLRVKGILNVDGLPVAIHIVQSVVHEPRLLPEWPDDERRSRLVFISTGMKRVDIEATFTAFSCGETEVGAVQFPDPDAYTHFVHVAKTFLRQQ